MERSDFLKPNDNVTVSVFGPEGSCLYKSTNSGYHSLDAAIKETLANANIETNPEDCFFEVTNNETGVSHRYRLNAHGNLKLIV